MQALHEVQERKQAQIKRTEKKKREEVEDLQVKYRVASSV